MWLIQDGGGGVGGGMTSVIEAPFGETQVGCHSLHTVLQLSLDVHHSVTKQWHCTPEQNKPAKSCPCLKRNTTGMKVAVFCLILKLSGFIENNEA